VRQAGAGFCHHDTWSCWGPDRGLPELERRLQSRLSGADSESYTLRLASDPKLLATKLSEEAHELAAADGPAEVVWEAADLLYFLTATLAAREVPLADVTAELDRRALAVTRRDGSRVLDAAEEIAGDQ
jgi:phosphoribosyl-ATP pyrophosphohydrolase/phosphoribosyl-AMP cyclohydrolase/histidinol dehydrogenase